ncbi:hypothetical protein SS50377_28156 [Spironucleus salmonicida]|uniref:Uncharacterized protein n=1 Tax=Spironucleus salmonicida TaxID=348837 RepID=V6LTX7_9EUKA|nr:hypothetical protein SS50377_28156 [Spironucleus salmonicida]|eukprot:EST47668.1 Hypothetical protein SS50377_12254 [Spironucleus salmonicida]
MYHKSQRSFALPKDYSPQYQYQVSRDGLVYQLSDTQISVDGRRLPLQIKQVVQQFLTFQFFTIATGFLGTEIFTQSTHHSSYEVKGVTTIHFANELLYLGTSTGQLFTYSIDSDQVAFSEQFDSAIVQINSSKHQIIVSTLTKLLLLPDVQIGTKLRKNTFHGGCFFRNKIYACSPSCKIFSFSVEDSVIDQTLSLKDAVQLETVMQKHPEMQKDLGVLFSREGFILSVTTAQIFVIDVERVCVIEWIALPTGAKILLILQIQHKNYIPNYKNNIFSTWLKYFISKSQVYYKP